jgi:hypothetical protein
VKSRGVILEKHNVHSDNICAVRFEVLMTVNTEINVLLECGAILSTVKVDEMLEVLYHTEGHHIPKD